jgi:DNA polymerase-4
MAQALRACPQAVVLPVRMERYQEMSARIMALLEHYTPLLEQVSVDEAYLDFTHWLTPGITAEMVAREMQREIFAATGLTCSLGVAANKPIAKMASDLQKPNGVTVVPPGTEAAFLASLPIGRLRGVGAVTERKLREMGINTIGELASLPSAIFTRVFGKHGHDLHQLAQGIDDSPVVPERQAKSIGRETTFATDLSNRGVLEETLLALCDDVAASLRRHGLLASSVILKLRYDDFRLHTRSQALAAQADTVEPIYSTVATLLRATSLARPVRLIGIGAGGLVPETDRQLLLFGNEAREKQRKVATVMDAIRERFGDDAITRARLAQRRDA